MDDELLFFDRFWQLILQKTHLGVTSDAIRRDSVLTRDLGFDSLQILEVVMAVEELGVALEEKHVLRIVTAGDMHDVCVQWLSDQAQRSSGME